MNDELINETLNCLAGIINTSETLEVEENDEFYLAAQQQYETFSARENIQPENIDITIHLLNEFTQFMEDIRTEEADGEGDQKLDPVIEMFVTTKTHLQEQLKNHE